MASSGYSSVSRASIPTVTPYFEILAVFLISTLGYFLLTSQILVDDASRYILELQGNRFVWDLGHVWIQPIALIIYRAIGSPPDPIPVLEAINIVATTLGFAVFYGSLRRAGCGRGVAAGFTALAFVSFNLLSLGPTAHIKLMAFPALALAMHHAVIWETGLDDAGRNRPADRHLFVSGLWLGVACNMLVSLGPMVPAVAVLALIRAGYNRKSFGAGIRSSFAFGIGATLAGLGLLFAAYITALGSGTTEHDFLGFVFGGISEKRDLHIGFFGITESLMRAAFSTIYNFAFMPLLGGYVRAIYWMAPENRPPFDAALLRDAVVGLVTALVLSAGLAAAVIGRLRGQGLLLPFGFLAGELAFAIYYNLNDPEHWFQLTLPALMLIALQPSRVLRALAVWIWLPILAVNNLGLYGIPKARFDLAARTMDVRQAIGPNGLYVGFAGYPGEPDVSLFDLRGIEQLALDTLFAEQRNDPARTIAAASARIDRALARGGKVLVFRALDPNDWRGPVMILSMQGLSRARLINDLSARYEIVPAGDVGGFPAWQILPRRAG